jgi:ribonucleotide reductase beta subunit family protein with ferritin-like domain
MEKSLQKKGNSDIDIDTSILEPSRNILDGNSDIDMSILEPSRNILDGNSDIDMSILEPSRNILDGNSDIDTSILEPSRNILDGNSDIDTSILEPSRNILDGNSDIDTSILEPLLDKKLFRYTIKPYDPTYEVLWKLYKLQQSSFWVAEEIDFSKDYDDFVTLSKDEQYVIEMILAFFAGADGIVNFNLRERFLQEIQCVEALCAYGYQLMMENIHGEIYSDMLINIIKNPIKRTNLFNAMQTVPSVKKMSDWAIEWISSDSSFGQRLIAFAIVEGIFFSGAFAAIFWLKKQRGAGKLFFEGLIKSNKFISRDEGLHCIAKGTLVSIDGFKSLPIEKLENNNNFNVLSYRSDKKYKYDGIVKNKQTNFKYQGKKECVELTFEDGRKLLCTPDHKIYTENGWKESKDVVIDSDKIIASIEHPYIEKTENDIKEEDIWSFKLREEIIFCTNNEENTKKSCAFARILGYLLSDGCLTQEKHLTIACLSMGNLIDAESIQNDIFLAFGETRDKIIFKDGCYIVNIKSKFAKLLSNISGMAIGKRTVGSDTIPSFILTSPRIIISNFLSGLFGGDGIAPTSKKSISKFSIKCSVGFVFSKSKNKNEVANLYQTQLISLLNKFSIVAEKTKKSNLPIKKDGLKKFKYVIRINTDYLQLFYRQIGFAYCIAKQCRLAIANSITNLRVSIRDSIIGKTKNTVPFIDEEQLLKSWGVYEWFRNNDEYIDETKRSKKYTPTSYTLTRDMDTIPCFKLKILNRRNVGLIDTYDIQVDNAHNFVANGIVVHNCTFACAMYSFVANKVSNETVYAMFKEAVEISDDFVNNAIKVKLLGMSSDSMNEYIKCTADRLLVMLGYEKLYHAQNPFDFMETIGLHSKDNFFETRPDAYQKSHNEDNQHKWDFELLDEF